MSTSSDSVAAANAPSAPTSTKFTRYELLVMVLLAVAHFTIVLDFMVLSPLSAILLDKLSITTAQFGRVVSVYAFSAGFSGILAATFADRFDRKRLLLVFYAGFILGTLLCGFAHDYTELLLARMVTGLFGGVMGSISFAIITDLFPLERRGRVMGLVGMAFAASQVLGLPFGVYLATHYGWHSPFFLIVILSLPVIGVVAWGLRPIDGHLALQDSEPGWRRLWRTVSRARYVRGFTATTLLASGGFMLMPFGSAFAVNNLGIDLDHLPMVYLVTGIATIFFGPMAGRMADRHGKFRIFVIGSAISMLITAIYTHLGPTPLIAVIGLNVVMFAGITGRMVAAQTLVSAVPDARERGAFMSVNSAVQQLSGGLSAMVAGWIVVQTPTGPIDRYGLLGWVVCLAMLVTIFLMRRIDRMVQADQT
ncbi:MFS transporter [Actomonas aquatica]|uniref:MFS transporter n=1 Tax=Actomonas aquatica TaxID=2866162 RepID=A0ABZ1C4U8_9BACT|nr:MFS transporter [Opitutus sp. WL0086]WRQ86757.1 MFS transporter [Opitutus sp. WL0086]